MTALRAAIVGTGGIAGAHARAYAALSSRIHLAAVADVDEEKLGTFCQKHGVESAYGSLEELLQRERVDLVSISTPPWTHTDLVLRSLRAGAWVLCEKPLCGSLADLDGIEAAELETGRRCASVLQWRFGSAVRHLRGLIDQGVLGEPRFGLCQTTWYRPASYYAVPWRGRWETELGGVTMSQGIHAIDLFQWLMGPWQEILAKIDTLGHEIAVEDVSAAIVRFSNGALATIVNSVVSPRQETYLRFDFERATVEVRSLYGYQNRDWTFTPVAGSESLQAAWEAVDADVPSSHTAQLAALLDTMERDEAPPAGTADAREALELIASLYRSAATGAAVERGSITAGDPFYDHVGGTLLGRD